MPVINDVRLRSSQPITLYIDSRGGSTFHARMIHGLLKTPTQDGSTRRLITVAAGTAASAAADMLASGDYAIAYPHAYILFHGTRQRLPQQNVTKEYASSLAEHLKETNEGFALILANRSFRRFFFRYILMKPKFDSLKEELGRPNMEDVECMAELLKRNVESHASLPERALSQHRRLTQLENYILSRYRRKFPNDGHFEAFVLRCLITYELKENGRDPSWTFSEVGLAQMQDDFLILKDYRTGQHASSIEGLVRQWGAFCLDQEQRKVYSTIPAEKRDEWLRLSTGENVRALWYFFVSICRFLQEGENTLSAEDAYHFGLVDEVAGRTDLPCFRMIAEDADASERDAATQEELQTEVPTTIAAAGDIEITSDPKESPEPEKKHSAKAN